VIRLPKYGFDVKMLENGVFEHNGERVFCMGFRGGAGVMLGVYEVLEDEGVSGRELGG
jgi:hypothetical protein